MKKLFLMLTLILVLTGCSKNGNNNVGETPNLKEKIMNPVFSNLNGGKVSPEIEKAMTKANLSHVDLFMEWVQAFNKDLSEKEGVMNAWTDLGQRDYKEDAITEDYRSKNTTKTDTNSRITSFLLMQHHIESERKKNYGTYIMVDVDELMTNANYSLLKDEVDQYIALFDEVSIKDAKSDQDYINAYPNEWKKRKVKFKEDKASLISVVLEDPYEKVLYIGHAGVLIDQGDSLLFIEKVAPLLPYQVTKFANRSQLEDELLNNRNFAIGDEDIKPFLLENESAFIAD